MPLLPGGDSDLQRAIFQALHAGTLRLVGADELDRVVTRPGEIGVGQSSLRLARPKTGDAAAGGTGDDSDATAGSGGGTGSGRPGTSTSLTDETKRDSVRLLLRNLANAIDDGKVSYAQLMVKVIVHSSVADEIAEDVRSTGTPPTVRKV
jgi:hypothetical protein